LQKAIDINPNQATAHNNLGFAYNAKGQCDRAIPCLKKALELQPKQVTIWDNLASALGEAGELEQARDTLAKLLTLIPQETPRFQAVKKSLEQMEALLGLEPRLPDIVKGEFKPKDFAQGMQFGKLCRVKQHYRAALRLYEEALASNPNAARKLAPINLLVLVRTALLASAGRGSDVPPEAERPKYRAKALAWLRRYVKTQQEALEKSSSADRHAYQRNIRVLVQHQDLASVRLPILNNLPAGERGEWERFWKEVDGLCPTSPRGTPSPGR
jgi:tetratricopeptide (TPR) repeat protein